MNETISIIYKDESILAVNKPSGLLSAPDRYDPAALVVSRGLEVEIGRAHV